MLTVHGVTRSRASRIIWLCHELDLPFTQKPVIQAYRLTDPQATDAPENTRSAGFLALSPAGAIPVIEDDGLVLSESLACTLYLARRHGGPVGPQDAAEDALMMQWSFYASTSIEPDALTILFLHGRGGNDGPQQAAAIEAAALRLRRPFAVIEDQLTRNNGHLVGDRFTVADLNMAEVLRYAQSWTTLMEDFPVTHRWLLRCQSRPAFRSMWQARMAEPE